MTENISEIVERQRKFFRSGITLDVRWRIDQLKKLKKAVIDHEQDLARAIHEDLGRCYAEAYFCDIGSTIAEINEAIHGVRKWAKPETKFSGLLCFPSMFTKVYKMPYGTTLIISPFNFPVLLSLGVLAASLAAGNTCVVKASSKSPACTAKMREIIAKIFPEEYCTVIGGGHDVADMCLAVRFDKIFYTGSPRVAKHVMAAAAENLTPLTLELGGETGNWCIVRKDADLKDAADKIAFFKLCNSGQICININQIAVAEEVAGEFLSHLKEAFRKQIGDALSNPEYPKLITMAAYERCAEEADRYRDRIIYGGEGNPETMRYEPTIIYPVGMDEPIVKHELFCPLLPIVTYRDKDTDKILETIADREHGLALYLFTSDLKWARKVMSTQQYGGGCINEVCIHLMVKGVPFNGVGHSGMGAYHGEWGFREFTHPSTVLIGSTRFNLPLRKHPYTKFKLFLIKLFEK